MELIPVGLSVVQQIDPSLFVKDKLLGTITHSDVQQSNLSSFMKNKLITTHGCEEESYIQISNLTQLMEDVIQVADSESILYKNTPETDLKNIGGNGCDNSELNFGNSFCMDSIEMQVKEGGPGYGLRSDFVTELINQKGMEGYANPENQKSE